MCGVNSKVRQLEVQVRERRVAICSRSSMSARKSMESALQVFSEVLLEASVYDKLERKEKTMAKTVI